MRFFKFLLIAALITSMGGAAYAELQNVEVGGSIRIRGNMYDYDFTAADRIRPFTVVPVRTFADATFFEQRTRLNFKADFTDEVSAFIELDSYDVWGEDFRSNYLTGADFRSASVNDVEAYQAYIEANEMWGVPLRLRVGRQEISLGSEWLVGTNDTGSFFSGLSFDGIRLTYATDMFSVDAVWSKLNERFGDFADDDTDFYTIYASYLGLEDIVIDAYWMYIIEDNSLPNAGSLDGRAPGIAGVTVGGDEVDLHTIGLRGAGTISGFDFEAEVAYQWGEIDRPRINFFRDNDLEYGNMGGNLEVGYTFDMTYQPRVYLGAAYFGGEDVTQQRFGLFGWGRDETDISFNRLFSNWEYSEFLDQFDAALSNSIVYRAGVSAMPTEQIELLLAASYFQADEPWVLRRGIFGWWNQENDEEMGLELGLYADYHYSEDLVFRAGYAHFFGDDGLGDQGNIWWRPLLLGNAVRLNGLGRMTGSGDDDYNYLFIETELSF